MAIMNKIVLAVSALAAVANAAPLNARAIVTDIVTETTWTTMDMVATVWVDEQGKILTTEGAFFGHATHSTSVAVVASSSSVTPSVETHAVVASTTAAFTTTIPVAAVVAVQTTSAVTSPSFVSTTTTTSTTPTASTAVVAQAGSSARDIVASATNDCEGEGSACVGDVTYWTGGLGACGWDVDTNSDMEIALPYEFMGTASNSNPYCGRSLTIVNPVSGTTVQATVGDKCMGCVDRAIDLTEALFNAVTDGTGNGRVSGIEWYFN